LDTDLVELTVENKGPEVVYISKVNARFDWDKSHPYSRDVNVEIPPGSQKIVPPLSFRIDLLAEPGGHLVQFGVRRELLRENKWTDSQDTWFAPGHHFLLVPSAPRGFSVFVCHANDSKDRGSLSKLVSCLERAGFEALVAERETHPGYPLWRKIRSLMARADGVLVLWTKAASASGDIREEVGLAYGRSAGIPVLPLVAQGITLKGSLIGLEFSEFIDGDSESFYKSLGDTLGVFIAAARKKGPPPASKAE
jgi:TIR domain